MNVKKDKQETFYLWWVDTKTGRRDNAGVAFYDDEFGDYRFKIDFFPENTYYLRCLGGCDSDVKYRLEVVHKDRTGNFLRRIAVGAGYRSDDGDVLIRLFPFERLLAVALKSDEQPEGTNESV